MAFPSRVISAFVALAVACGDSVGDQTCDASSKGWCTIPIMGGHRLGPTEPPVEVTFVYPDTTDVTLVLE
jgi:hypothetical protein